MEDLDLDELDQAVTKMMDKPSRGKRSLKKPVDRPVSAVSSPAVDSINTANPEFPKQEADTDDMPAPRAAEPVRVTVNRPMPRVPERRRMHPGAMDIIQPVASQKAAAPSVRPGRTAAALQPTQDITPEQPDTSVPSGLEPALKAAPKPQPSPAPEPEQSRKLDTPQDVSDEVLASLSLLDEPKPVRTLHSDNPKPAAAAPHPETASTKSDGWPDPLDFHDFSATQKVPESSSPAEVTDPLAIAAEAPTETNDPKETAPTLATEPVSVTDRHEDAAFAGSSPFVTTKVEKRPLGAFADAAHEPAKVTISEPAEVPVPHESTTKGEMASASFESKQHLDAADSYDPADLRAMSIPQQYHTQEPAQKDDVRPVFDTKEYHAAPPHMYAPRKGGPGLVIGVVVLIVLIIAAVLVGYFMMTGTFDMTNLF